MADNRVYLILYKDILSNKVTCEAMTTSLEILNEYKKHRPMEDRKVLVVNMEHKDLHEETKDIIYKESANLEIIDTYDIPITIDEEIMIIENLQYYPYQVKTNLDSFKECVMKDIIKFSDDEKNKIKQMQNLLYEKIEKSTAFSECEDVDEYEDEYFDEMKYYRFKELIRNLGIL